MPRIMLALIALAAVTITTTPAHADTGEIVVFEREGLRCIMKQHPIHTGLYYRENCVTHGARALVDGEDEPVTLIHIEVEVCEGDWRQHGCERQVRTCIGFTRAQCGDVWDTAEAVSAWFGERGVTLPIISTIRQREPDHHFYAYAARTSGGLIGMPEPPRIARTGRAWSPMSCGTSSNTRPGALRSGSKRGSSRAPPSTSRPCTAATRAWRRPRSRSRTW